MKHYLILSVVSCLALAGAASAAVQQGDTELDALGAWMSQDGSGDADLSIDVDWLFLMGRLGYFLSDNIQISAVAMGAWTETSIDSETGPTSGDVDVDVYGLGAAGKYHFTPTNQWVPYIGAQVLWLDVDIDLSDDFLGGPDIDDTDVEGDGMLWGPVAGLRYELNAYNDFFVEYQYHLWSGDIDDILDDGHALFLGLVHQFK